MMRKPSHAKMQRVGVILLALLITACDPPQPIPTASSIEMAGTAAFLTENAPPAGFNNGVRFVPIDANLEALPHWHYMLTVRFDGTFAGSTEPVSGVLTTSVYANAVSGERRVVLRAEGDAFALSQTRNVEGVRLGNDFFFVDQNNVCTRVTDDPNRRRAAELAAGDLIGGVKAAIHTNARKTENGVALWQYSFAANSVDLPLVVQTQGGSVTITSGEMWVAPSLNAVFDYALTLEIDSAIVPIIQGDKQLSGVISIRYQLIETGVPYAIPIPFGC